MIVYSRQFNPHAILSTPECGSWQFLTLIISATVCAAKASDFHYDTNPIREPKTENQRIVLSLHTVADMSVRNCQEPLPSVDRIA